MEVLPVEIMPVARVKASSEAWKQLHPLFDTLSRTVSHE